MDISALVKLTSKAWSLSILQSLHAGVPGRKAPLLAASGAGRTAFGQSLAHLIDIGLLERNPGHGHPLRPEYRLTDQGKRSAAMADAIIGETSSPEDRARLRRAWTVPVLAALQQPSHFADIKRALSPITDRALSQALKSLEDVRWVSRRVDPKSRPPRALYWANGIGATIGRAAAEFA